jgi:hypothetical protein
MRESAIIEYQAGLPGPMTDYDMELLPRTHQVIDYLKKRPDFRWWNAFVLKPTKLKDIDELKACDWKSFVCRNPNDIVSVEFFNEFRRVYGRPAAIYD